MDQTPAQGRALLVTHGQSALPRWWRAHGWKTLGTLLPVLFIATGGAPLDMAFLTRTSTGSTKKAVEPGSGQGGRTARRWPGASHLAQWVGSHGRAATGFAVGATLALAAIAPKR